MKRVFCQQIISSPDNILHNTVVEQDDQNRIINLINLENQIAETSNTLYFDGIISSEIISVVLNIENETIDKIRDYQYVNLNTINKDKLILRGIKPLLIDFETNDLSIVNTVLTEKFYLLENFSDLEIIAACTFYPNLYLHFSKEIKISYQTQLLHWKRINFSTVGKNRNLQVFSV